MKSYVGLQNKLEKAKELLRNFRKFSENLYGRNYQQVDTIFGYFTIFTPNPNFVIIVTLK